MFRNLPSSISIPHLISPLNGFTSQLIASSFYEGVESTQTSGAVGFQFQPLQATVCLGIIFSFAILQLRINHAVGLNSKLVDVQREYKRVKVDAMAGLESIEKKHFYEKQIEDLEKSIEAEATLYKFSDEFKVRIRLPIRETTTAERRSSESSTAATPSISRILAGTATVLALLWLLTLLSVDPITSRSNF